jgi:integrase
LWSDLALDSTPPTLTVSGALKREPSRQGKGYELNRGAVKGSMAGQRTMALPPIAVDALRAHRARQASERLVAGELWEDQGLVFSSEIGTPLDPSNVRRTFRRVATRAGLDARFPYLLRHTAVSLLIDAGAGIEEVADLPGDDPRTLYRHYRHKVRPIAEAATRMQDVLAPAPG